MTTRPNGKKVSTPDPDEIFKDRNPRVYTEEQLKQSLEKVKEMAKTAAGWKFGECAVQRQTAAACLELEAAKEGL